jgi:hypothetical protein
VPVTPDELVDNYPVLHHMAEPGSWATIQQIGLLSTQQLVAECEVSDAEAAKILRARRKTAVRLHHPRVGSVTVRDQGPLLEHNLRKALTGMTVEEWLAVLNDRVFFWLHPARLDGLLSAKRYRDQSHDVLVLNTRDLLERHSDRVRITAMNTGAMIFPGSPPRGPDTFMRIEDFPFAERRRGRHLKDTAVELAVIGGVPDIADLVHCVQRRQGNRVLEIVSQP